MRGRGIWSEACRNLAVGTTRAATFAVILAITAGLLAIGDVLQVHSIVLRAREFQAKGASISVLAVPQGIDPVVCDALKDVPGIRAAGALRMETGKVTTAALPAAPIPSASVTPGFAEVLRAERPSGEGILISQEVAQTLSVQRGGSIATTGGDLTVQSVFSYPSDGRRAGYGYAVLVPTTDTRAFDECWIDVWPSSEDVSLLAHTALIPGGGSSDKAPRLEQLNTTLGREFDSQGLLQQRLTRWLPLVGGLIGALVGFVSLRMRRLEIAANLHAGLHRRDERTILGIETITWVVAGGIMASAIVAYTFVCHIREMDPQLVLVAARVLLPTTASVLLGALCAWLTIREHHLFAYFKSR